MAVEWGFPFGMFLVVRCVWIRKEDVCEGEKRIVIVLYWLLDFF
jgi:hypothetical protein